MESTTNCTRKNPMEADWILLYTLDDDQLFIRMKRSEYKMTATHNGIIRKCTAHRNLDEHKMKVAYYRCSSKNCVREKVDICPYRSLVKYCEIDKLNYVYKVVLTMLIIYSIFKLIN
jgi:hypothetical protein